MPPGYELAIVGVLIFMAGGVGDMIWHEIFGIEIGVEALLSPTHLILAVGMTLIISGPFRAGWRRRPSSMYPCSRLDCPAPAASLADLRVVGMELSHTVCPPVGRSLGSGRLPSSRSA